jgi:hypothetical protein
MPTVERPGPIDYVRFGIPKPLPTLYIIDERGVHMDFYPSTNGSESYSSYATPMHRIKESPQKLAQEITRLRNALPNYKNLHAIVHESQESFFQEIAREIGWNAKKVA